MNEIELANKLMDKAKDNILYALNESCIEKGKESSEQLESATKLLVEALNKLNND